jgi:hypothetical protein
MPDLSKAACDARIALNTAASTINSAVQEIDELLHVLVPKLHIIGATIDLKYVEHDIEVDTELGQAHCSPHYELRISRTTGLGGQYSNTVYFYPDQIIEDNKQ